MTYWEELSLKQRKIIEGGDGPYIVNAGPGTGKTKTLIGRIAYLILNKKVYAERILCLTFTRKAAFEILDRLKLLDLSTLPFVNTFHGFAYEFLIKNGQNINLISDQERKKILENLLEKSNFKEFNLNKFSLIISNFKNGIYEASFQEKELIEKYDEELLKRNFIDFDDLIIKFDRFIEENKNKTRANEMFDYILIDEFQDTNIFQYNIVKKFLTPLNNLFVIGDPFQSIYSFRGASARIFDIFKTDFPNYKEETLDVNYRSSKNIVSLSNLIFSSNISSYSEQKGEIFLVETYDEYSEADFIIKTIDEKIGGTNLINVSDIEKSASFSDFAVIYRTHSLNKLLKKKLNKSGFPFQVVGEGAIFEEKEIEFVCLLLLYLNDESEDEFLRKIQRENNKDLFQDKLSQTRVFLNLPLSQLVQKIIEIWNINSTEDFSLFVGNIVQFDKDSDGLKRFAEYYKRLKQNEFYDYESDKITLLTMHAAKGLEFKHVFICGFEEGLIPYKKTGTLSEIEEEKKLFYVAVTRAKEELYLIKAINRDSKKTKESQFKKTIMSEFIKEIKDDWKKLFKKREIQMMQKRQMKIF